MITTPEEVPPMLTRVLALMVLMVIFPEVKEIRGKKKKRSVLELDVQPALSQVWKQMKTKAELR